jgi:hypothetical protein
MKMAVIVLALGTGLTIAGDAAAPPPQEASEDLRQRIEERFEVLPLHDGLALRPKSPMRGVRSIELSDGTIAIDGTPATGGELRRKLGPDADLVIRLSYLDVDARRALFGAGSTGAAEPPPRPRRMRHLEAERVRVGGNVTVDDDETVTDAVVIGGSLDVQGHVLHDVVVIGGILTIGPHAEIGRDITVIGGMIRRDPGAQVAGRVNQVGTGFDLRGLRWGRVPFAPLFLWGSIWGGLFALVSTVTRVAVLSLLASLVLLIGGDYVERVGARAAAEPIKAGIVGVLAQLLFFPLLIITIVVLVVTIIGIPLLALIPFAVLALALVALVGFTAVAQHVGRVVSTRMGSSQPNPYLTAILGILVVMSPVLLGRILGLGDGVSFPLAAVLMMLGFMVEYVAWTVGFGAVALNRFARPPS